MLAAALLAGVFAVALGCGEGETRLTAPEAKPGDDTGESTEGLPPTPPVPPPPKGN
jgi:hypothetical protein